MNLRDLIYSDSQSLSQVEKSESHHKQHVSFSQDISQASALNNSSSQSRSDSTGSEAIR
jgi:hypothetical protein